MSPTPPPRSDTGVGPGAGDDGAPASRSPVVWAFLIVTLLVWGGRIRNALADSDLADGGRPGPLLLSASFVVPAVVALVVLATTGRRVGPGSAAGRLVGGLAVWTIVVWVVRAVDIAFVGDHSLGFVVVHVLLALVSTVLATLALAVVRPPWSRRVGST
jgi:hypothetical protein